MDAPVGMIAVAKDLLRTSLATCTAFRTWDGANWTIEQAKERIYFDSLPPPPDNAAAYTRAQLEALRPFAIIYRPRQDGVRLEVEAAGPDTFATSGTLVVRLERNVPEDERDDAGAADRSFENMVGQVMRTSSPAAPGLADLSGQPGYLKILKIQESGPHRCGVDEITDYGDFQEHYLQIEWGRRP